MPKQLFIDGIALEIPVGETEASSEITIDYSGDLSGAILFPLGAKYGDIGAIEIIHPIAGVVGSYARNAYIPEGVSSIYIGITRPEEEPAEIKAGLKIRLTYTAVDTLGRKCVVWLRMRK